MIATAAGALLIGLGALVFSLVGQVIGGGGDPWRYAWALPVALTSGLVGSLVDSLLGASVQAIYYCPSCTKETESRLHGCGSSTLHRRGWRWLNNDVVNFLSSFVGALVAGGLFLLV
jgi:uncharacterized membrane protein